MSDIPVRGSTSDSPEDQDDPHATTRDPSGLNVEQFALGAVDTVGAGVGDRSAVRSNTVLRNPSVPVRLVAAAAIHRPSRETVWQATHR